MRPRQLRSMLLAWLLLPAPAALAATIELAAGGAAAIRQATPVVELALEDGGGAVLADIHVPAALADTVAAVLAPFTARATLEAVEPGARDRWDRLVLAPSPDGPSPQAALVAAGVAVVQPRAASAPAAIARLLAEEATAAAAGRGLWRSIDGAGLRVDAADARSRLGGFALIEGVVLQAGAQRRYFYLNFGPDWRTDTTARIDRDALRSMQRAGFDPADLAGQRVRLRGVVFEENGPMIELWTHLAIEVLP